MPERGSEAVDLLQDLLAIPSVSRHEDEAATFLAEWMGDRGCSAYRDDAGNAVGTRGTGEREILLLGHIDTVPGDIPVRIDDGRLYGRGAVDAKGPLCVFAAAAARFDPPPGWRVTVVGAVEEEIPSSKGARQIVADRVDDPPVVCVIGEPSGWDRATLGYRGRLILNAELVAPLAHSAGPAALPPETAVAVWHRIEAFCAERNTAREAARVFDEVSPTLQHIASSDRGTHGAVAMTVGFRLPLSDPPDRFRPDLEKALAAWIAELPGCAFHTEWRGAETAIKTGKSNPLVRAFLGSIRTAGGTPRFVVKTGTSDMNVVAPHWPRTPIVAYGPGDSRLDHTPGEHLELAEYERAVGVVGDVLAVVAGRTDGLGSREMG